MNSIALESQKSPLATNEFTVNNMTTQIKRPKLGNFSFISDNKRVIDQIMLLLRVNGWNCGDSVEYLESSLNHVIPTHIGGIPLKQILIHTKSKSFGATSNSRLEEGYEKIYTFDELCNFLYYFRAIENGLGLSWTLPIKGELSTG